MSFLHLSPSRGEKDVRSLIEDTSVRKAIGRPVCFFQSLDKIEKYDFAEWLMVRVVCQQMRDRSFQERGEKL